MSTTGPSRTRIPRKLVPRVLEAARNGSISDLYNLANNGQLLPYSSYHGLFDIFLLYLKSEKLLEYLDHVPAPTRKVFRQAFDSLKGVHSWLQVLLDTIVLCRLSFQKLGKWRRSDYAIIRERTRAGQSISPLRLNKLYVGICDCLSLIDQEAFKAASRGSDQFSLCMLLCTIWLRYPGGNHSILQIMSLRSPCPSHFFGLSTTLKKLPFPRIRERKFLRPSGSYPTEENNKPSSPKLIGPRAAETSEAGTASLHCLFLEAESSKTTYNRTEARVLLFATT